MKTLFSLFLTVIFMFCTTSAFAQAKDNTSVMPEKKEEVDADVATGWHPQLRLSGNFALAKNRNVPGAIEGSVLNFGYMLNGAADYLSYDQKHEWLSSLNMNLGFSRTEALGLVTKNLDTIDFKTSYLFHIPSVKWLGPFVSFSLTTSMIEGYYVQPEATNIIKVKHNESFEKTDSGNTIDDNGVVINANHPRVKNYKAKKKITLTNSFSPTTLKESLGLFATPVTKESLRLDIRAGFGAWETYVRGGYNVDEDTKIDNLIVFRKMQNAFQMGPELGLLMNGVVDKNVTYLIGARAMQPVYHNADTDLKGMELLNLEFEVRFGVQLAKWLSVDYSFKAIKQPLLVKDWQIQNNLLVSLGFDLIAAQEPAPATK